jgi:hypothetical protein
MKIASQFKRGVLTAMLSLCAAMMLASCASLVGPRDVELPLGRLQEGLERRFPMHQRLMDLFDVELTQPRLSIPAGQDRIAISLNASGGPLFARQMWRGSLVLSGRLEVDPARNAVFMRDAKVERFAVDGIDAAGQRHLANVANLVTAELMRDVPLYRFHPEDMRYGGVQFVATRMSTKAQALVVTVEPVQ